MRLDGYRGLLATALTAACLSQAGCAAMHDRFDILGPADTSKKAADSPPPGSGPLPIRDPSSLDDQKPFGSGGLKDLKALPIFH